MNMTFDLSSVIALIGGSTTFTALVTAWWMRPKVHAESRKLRAEAHKTDADADVTAGEAWKELLAPYRDSVTEMRVELREMRAEVATLARENEALKAELKVAKHQIGILSRLERESTVESAVVKTKLAEHGIDIPVVAPVLARTRTTDEEDT